MGVRPGEGVDPLNQCRIKGVLGGLGTSTPGHCPGLIQVPTKGKASARALGARDMSTLALDQATHYSDPSEPDYREARERIRGVRRN